MPSTKCKPTPKKLVLQKYPDAFANDDGQRVRIRLRKIITERCPHCKQKWIRKVGEIEIVGIGGNDEQAWEAAARRLYLI